MKNLTIIIPTYNSADYISETLNCLKDQTNKNFDLIVIDDNSTDQTRKIVEEFSSSLNINFIQKKNLPQGAASSLNYTFSKINTPYWALIDSDALLAKNWVNIILESLKQKVIVGAPIFASKKGGGLAYLIGLEIEARYNKYKEKNLSHLSTCNLAGRREILKFISLDEDLFYAYDHQLSFQLKRNQIPIFLTKKTYCYHINKSGLVRFFVQQFNIAKFHTILSKRMPREASSGDEMSPSYLIFQPFFLILFLLLLDLNLKLSLFFLAVLMILNYNFFAIVFRKKPLAVFMVCILVVIKNLAWILGLASGLTTKK